MKFEIENEKWIIFGMNISSWLNMINVNKINNHNHNKSNNNHSDCNNNNNTMW